MSTAGKYSKFGTSLEDYYDQLIDAYLKYPWLTQVHVHVGSQGCPLSLVANGIRKVVDFALEINRRRNSDFPKIGLIDIGGGLPVNFNGEEISPTYEEYANILCKTIPELFNGEFRLMTEIGRATIAKTAIAVSRVEYTKLAGGRHIAVIQFGADLAVRTIYHPDKWPLRVSVLDSSGNPKIGELYEYDIAGPCCFAADIIAHCRKLPQIEPGDYIVVHDVGGYYHASYSRYNVRQAPAIYGYTLVDNKISKMKLLKERESVDDVLTFFTLKSKL